MATTHDIRHNVENHNVLYAVIGVILALLVLGGILYYNNTDFRSGVDEYGARVENTIENPRTLTDNVPNNAGAPAGSPSGTTAY